MTFDDISLEDETSAAQSFIYSLKSIIKLQFVFHVQVITVLTKDRKIELIPDSERSSPPSRSYDTRRTSDDRESPDRSQTSDHEHSETPKPSQGAPKKVKVKIDEQTVDVKPEQTTIR